MWCQRNISYYYHRHCRKQLCGYFFFLETTIWDKQEAFMSQKFKEQHLKWKMSLWTLWLNAFLLNKSIPLKNKKLTEPKSLNCSVCLHYPIRFHSHRLTQLLMNWSIQRKQSLKDHDKVSVICRKSLTPCISNQWHHSSLVSNKSSSKRPHWSFIWQFHINKSSSVWMTQRQIKLRDSWFFSLPFHSQSLCVTLSLERVCVWERQRASQFRLVCVVYQGLENAALRSGCVSTCKSNVSEWESEWVSERVSEKHSFSRLELLWFLMFQSPAHIKHTPIKSQLYQFSAFDKHILLTMFCWSDTI